MLGIVFQRVKDFPANAHLSLNNFIIYVSLPALTLVQIPQITLTSKLWMPVATAWIVFIAAAIFFKLLQKQFGFNNATLGCLILTCGLFNSSFIGYPVMKALYGEEGLQLAIMVDQPGSFLVLSTLGIGVAAYFSSGVPDAKIIFRKIFSFPPLWGFILAFMMRVFGIVYPQPIEGALKILADTMIPLALISVGMNIKFNIKEALPKGLFAGLFYKLLMAPAILFVLYVIILKATGLEAKVSVMEAAMAPMITGAIVASKYGLRPALASLLVGIGIPLSFLTLCLWYFLLEWF